MNLIYFANKAIAGMRNAYLVNILAAVTIALSMTLFGAFLVGIINGNLLVERLGNRLEVVAYLKGGVSGESLKGIEETIKRYPEVRGISYISKEEALASLNKGLAGESSILEGLDGNPLPASFVIKLNDPFRNSAGIKGVTERLRMIGSIDDVQYGGEWAERFSTLISMVKVGGAVLGAVVVLSTMLIISNTIRLTIQTRMDEIEVMRLVGATPLFLQAPFFIEGVIIGGIGALFAAGVMAAARGLIEYSFGNDLKLLFGGNLDLLPYQAVTGVLFLGTASGLIGSVVSLWRFSRS